MDPGAERFRGDRSRQVLGYARPHRLEQEVGRQRRTGRDELPVWIQVGEEVRELDPRHGVSLEVQQNQIQGDTTQLLHLRCADLGTRNRDLDAELDPVLRAAKHLLDGFAKARVGGDQRAVNHVRVHASSPGRSLTDKLHALHQRPTRGPRGAAPRDVVEEPTGHGIEIGRAHV